MKFIFYPFFLLLSTGLFAQSFTAGNIAVLVAAASANNTTASVVELAPGTAGQTAVNTYPINGTTAPNALRFSGSATSTGYMANSSDGSLLCFTGHNSTSTSVNANTLTARGVGTFNATGTFNLATTYTGASGDQTRCATSLNNTNWFVADQGGIYTNNATSASPTGNFRSIKTFGGVVYAASSSSTTTIIQVNTVSAPSGGTVTGLPGLTNNAAIQDFYLVSSGSNGAAFDILYTLSATSNTAGTISKYSLASGSWVANGTYTTAFGGFGIAAQKSGNGAALFVSTGQGALTANSLLRITDAAGYNTTINITTANNINLYTTATGTIIKGVAFAPVVAVSPSVTPSPSSLNFSNTTTGAASAGQTVMLTASNLSPASGSLTVTAPNTNFQVSNDGGTTWAASATVAYSSSGSTIGNFQVRFTPQSAAAQSGNVAITGGGLASAVNVAVSGTGTSSLALSFSTAATPLLNPPYVSTTISDAGDPAQQLGIFTDVKNNGTAVAAANYTLTAASSNTTVLPNANIAITKADGQAIIKITPAAVGYANVTLTLTSGGNSTTLVINYAVAMATGSTTGTHWHTSTSDASAAIAIDDNFMITADDERNILFVHSRSQSGLPATTFDYNQNNVLALTDGRELDTEAGTVSPTVAGKIYFLGSMSNSSTSFADRPSRNRLFAVTVTGTGSATSFANAGYYAGLRQQLITWGDANGYAFSTSAAAGKDPKLIDGFNLEGMVFAPDNATLYVGFRAPLVPTANRTKAVIAPVQNFETFFNNGNPSSNPIIGAPIELDLGGRGIRDIFRLSNGSYIILAGSYDGTSNPAVYSWTGNATDAPVQRNDYNVTGLNIEGGMQVNENGQPAIGKLQLISDDGDNVFYGDGVAAKDLTQNNYKKFRSDIVVSSTILPLNFTAFTAAKQNNKIVLSWAMAQPENLVSFTIYRSLNGRDFTAVNLVNAVRNQGWYSYTDDTLAGKAVYYRIKAKEAGGRETWSAVRIITLDNTNNAVSVYPNPVTGNQFTITSTQADTKTVQVFTGTGILYKVISFQGTAKEINTTEWPKGFYSIRITTAQNTSVTKELIIQ